MRNALFFFVITGSACFSCSSRHLLSSTNRDCVSHMMPVPLYEITGLKPEAIEKIRSGENVIPGKDALPIPGSAMQTGTDHCQPEVAPIASKPVQEPSSSKAAALKHDHSFVWIVLTLMLGILLWSLGIGMMITAIYGAGLLLFLWGLAVFLLGILPFVGLVSMIVGDRYPTKRSIEEK